jgi:hypothetical protein
MKLDEISNRKIKEVLQTIGEHEFPTPEFGRRSSEESRTGVEVIGYEKNLKVGNVPVKKAQFRINGQMYTFVFYLNDSHPTSVELYMGNAIVFISIIRSVFEWSDEMRDGFFHYILSESRTFDAEKTQVAIEALGRSQQLELEYLHNRLKENARNEMESAARKRLDQLEWSIEKEHPDRGAGS